MGKWFTCICCAIILLLLPAQTQAFTVVIDPGHGGHDPGAIGINGLYEKDVNLDVSLKLKQELENRGYEVKMSRQTDTFLTLPERVDFANRSGGSIFVSIHANAHNDRSIRGSLVLYYDDRYPQAAYPASAQMRALTGESRQLAEFALEGLVDSAGTGNRGLVPSAVYVVRSGIMPSILVETAFLSNSADAALLASEQVRAAMAAGIADGIARYIPPAFYDIGAHWAREQIIRLERLGLVQGYNRSFYPNRQMSRAEFLTLLDRIHPFGEEAGGEDEGKAASGGSDEGADLTGAANLAGAADSADAEDVAFADLRPEHWAYDTVVKAVKQGIVAGYGDNTVRPDQPISRAEMAVLFDHVMLPSSEDDGAGDDGGGANAGAGVDAGTDGGAGGGAGGENVGDGDDGANTGAHGANTDAHGGGYGSVDAGAGAESSADEAASEGRPALPPPPRASDGERAPFADVPSGTWYTDSVSKLYRLGYISGLTADTYGPHRQLTRAEGAAIVDRFLSSQPDAAEGLPQK